MADENRYRVQSEAGAGAWRVVILDPEGHEVSERACAHEVEAQTYASTVRQHIYWLSEERFRLYYKLPDVGEGESTGWASTPCNRAGSSGAI